SDNSTEICSSIFTPSEGLLRKLVEKHRLKRSYLEQDMNHLEDLTTAHKSMGIICKYPLLGDGIVQVLLKKLGSLKVLQGKLAQKLALRPENCVYSELSRNIRHFVQMCCHPDDLRNLIANAKGLFLEEPRNNELINKENEKRCGDIIKTLESWMRNSDNFQYHILPQYSTHYKDFVEPIDYSVTVLKYGLFGIVDHLKEASGSLTMLPPKIIGGFRENLSIDKCTKILEDLIQFPRIDFGSRSCELSTKSLVYCLPNADELLLMSRKINLLESINGIALLKDIQNIQYLEFVSIFRTFNRVWQKQEDEKMRKKIEEESLYVTKTKCATEDEEEVFQQEVERSFPTSVAEDFGDFLQNDTLEKIHTKKNPSGTHRDIFITEDIKLVAQTFLKIMALVNVRDFHTDLKLDYINIYKLQMQIFQNIVKYYRSCVNSRLDDASYLGMSFLVEISRKNYDLSRVEDKSMDYNFYDDSNVQEILPCLQLLNDIEERAKAELKLWPDHAALNDIVVLVDRIKTFPVTSSIVRFSAGFQLLGKRIDEWNSVAHRNNNMLDLKIKVTEFIQKWTKLELQYWRESLNHSFEKIKGSGYRYFFFLHNLIEEYLNEGKVTQNVEAFEEGSEVKIEESDVLKILNQFVESSNYAEFSLRLSLLKAFEMYLYMKETNSRLEPLHYSNLHLYYSQLLPVVNETIATKRRPIEKELKERVKIASYTPDLSYISMKNNIKEMHKKVHKCSKQFELVLREKITPILVAEEAKDYSKTSEKTEDIHLHYTVDVNNFLVAEKLKERCPDSAKIFLVSRDLVKSTVLHSQYPNNILSLEHLIEDQMETSEYLRKLEVDRSVERPKQKSQAKMILNQKRKALADFFKTMASLGLNYRTGLMEFSLNPDVIDLKIPSFLIEDHTVKRKLNRSLLYFAENVDGKFAKCCYRLKKLINVLLCPNSEVGLQNTDRIKGFVLLSQILSFLNCEAKYGMICKQTKLKPEIQQKTPIPNLLHVDPSSSSIISLHPRTLCRLQNQSQLLTEISGILRHLQNFLLEHLSHLQRFPDVRFIRQYCILDDFHLAVSSCIFRSLRSHRWDFFTFNIALFNLFTFLLLLLLVVLRRLRRFTFNLLTIEHLNILIFIYFLLFFLQLIIHIFICFLLLMLCIIFMLDAFCLLFRCIIQGCSI
uniref:Uncharacterized protein n=1 Tax=Phlebotomus papatasi TaxID=29031 RepID=A0A1B0DG03_PHLPP